LYAKESYFFGKLLARIRIKNMHTQAKFLTAEWRKLAMLNYEIAPELLKTYLPRKTELDFFNNRTYISMVGFRFLNTKVLGWAVPYHRNFEEVNLRFYVRYKHENEWRRGVVFIREIVPLWAIANIANWAYNEHYISLPMGHLINQNEKLQVSYGWIYQKNDYQMHLDAHSQPQDLLPNSESAFITEHYWGYSQGKNATLEYQVEHPRWQTYEVEKWSLEGNFKALYGNAFGEIIENTHPTSVLLAEGSEIVVRKPRKIS
jgi:uncharacterized protein